MRRKALVVAIAAALMAAALPANAAIHEQIGAGCRAGGEEVVPPGQVKDFALTALQANGIIESIDPAAGDGDDVKITFDLSKPNSKYISGGADLTIADFFGTGDDLILSPPPIPDPEFAAHKNCKNLRP